MNHTRIDMFVLKRVIIPTKLTKLTYILIIAISIFILFFRVNYKLKPNHIQHTYTKKTELATIKTRKENYGQPHVYSRPRYILRWVNPNKPSTETGDGSRLSPIKDCAWKNCYLTDQINILKSFSSFSIVLFNAPDINYLRSRVRLPKFRNPEQKFVFMSGDSATSLPICHDLWNGYFNWTWTYKLNSDLVWKYFVIRDVTGRVIGPKTDMNWININSMNPVDTRFITTLESKKKIAAWIVTDCLTESHREDFVNDLQSYLSKYNLKLDIYGACGTLTCPAETMSGCLGLLEKEYYFYLAFENSFSEDFVTDIILHALNHNTVPVVFGGANYTRFLPDGSYLNAMDYGPEKLAQRMFEIMQKPSLYHSFFRWKNHYSYHSHNESDNYCDLCAAANDPDLLSTTSVKDYFNEWWNTNDKCTV